MSVTCTQRKLMASYRKQVGKEMLLYMHEHDAGVHVKLVRLIEVRRKERIRQLHLYKVVDFHPVYTKNTTIEIAVDTRIP